MKFEKINHKQLEAQLLASLLVEEELIRVGPDDILIVTRNTKGNRLPGFTQEMTATEAVEFGAWDTSRGTIEISITLSPRSYVKPLTVYNKNGYIYAIDRVEGGE